MCTHRTSDPIYPVILDVEHTSRAVGPAITARIKIRNVSDLRDDHHAQFEICVRSSTIKRTTSLYKSVELSADDARAIIDELQRGIAGSNAVDEAMVERACRAVKYWGNSWDDLKEIGRASFKAEMRKALAAALGLRP